MEKQRLKERAAEEELRRRAALKDQMRLAVIAAKRKALEEGAPFDEVSASLSRGGKGG